MENNRSIFAGIIIVILIILFRDFLGAILSAFVFSFMFLPFYKWLNKRMGKGMSAFLCVLAIIIIIFLPFFIVFNSLFNEISSVSLKDVTDFVNSLPYIDSFDLDEEKVREIILSGAVSTARVGLSYIPILLVNFLIVLFGVYYLLIDWDRVTKKIKENFPLKQKDHFFKDLNVKTKGIVYGLIIVGLYDFIIAAIGFYIFGVNFAMTFAILVGISAMVNILDPVVVWAPLAVYYLVNGDTFTGVGVLITGFILTLDIFVRPKVIGKFADINPFIILLGIVGGISFFGVVGLIIGPILFVACLKILDSLY